MTNDRHARIQEFKELYGLDDDTEAEKILEAHLSVYERPEQVAQEINRKLERSFSKLEIPIALVFPATPELVLSVLEQLSDLELASYQYRPVDQEGVVKDMDSITQAILAVNPAVICNVSILEEDMPAVCSSQLNYFRFANMFTIADNENPLAEGIIETVIHRIERLQKTQTLDGEIKVYLEDYRDLVRRHDWTPLQEQEHTIQRDLYARLVKNILDWQKYAKRVITEQRQNDVKEQRVLLNRYLGSTNLTSYEDIERNIYEIPEALRNLRRNVYDLLLRIIHDPQHKPFLESYFQKPK